MNNISILFWIEHSFQLYSALPVVKKYLTNEENTVYMYTNIDDLELCSEYTGIPIGNIFQINTLRKKAYSHARSVFEAVFIPTDYSKVYRDRYVARENRKMRLLRRLTIFTLSREKINPFFDAYKKIVWSVFGRPKFVVECDLMVTFTKITQPFCIPISVPHISIMDSWDHPVKFPYFINPDFHLTWNKDLYDDIKTYQKIKRVRQIIPLKFRYILDRNRSNFSKLSATAPIRYREEMSKLHGKKVLLYPTTTSSLGLDHEGEMVFIRDLASAVKGTELTLYIKPKPNGPKGDYDEFQDHENVVVGIYASDANSYDMLDEDYQDFRYLLLKKAYAILNIGTTFVLEAALLDKRIVQLDLQTDRYSGFTDFSKTLHLEKYILSSKNTLKFYGQVDELKIIGKNVNMDFSKEIKEWITAW